jgi:hypothetical protein
MNTVSARRWAGISRLFVVAAISCFALFCIRASAQAAVPTSHALNVAAKVSTRADHRLVAAAKKLRWCRRQNSSHPQRCDSLRAAVQRTGHQLARSERHLAMLVRRSDKARSASSWWAQRAPQLAVSGQRLSWTRVADIDLYVIERKVPGQATQYSLVHGTSITPPPVPGLTVAYYVRTDVNGSSWSSPRSISYPAANPPSPPPKGQSPPAQAPPEKAPPERVDTQSAPAISVFGNQLSWNAIVGVSTYVLATKVPGRAETFTEVTGTSTTPSTVPGDTVHYSVRTAVNGSAWSPEVAITYPTTTLPPPPPKESPVAPKESPAFTGGFEPGINSGTNMTLDVNGAAQLGAKIVRIAFEIGTPANQLEPVIAGYAAKGIRVEPLADFYGTLPTTASAQNLATWAEAYGPGGTFWAHRSDGQLAIQTIEFGNETSGGYQYGDNAGEPSYQARAKTYALRLKEASEAISASGSKVGLLAVSEDWTGDWMKGMFEAVPNLGSYIAGWISHPYGTGWRTKIEDIIKQASAHGAPASLPIDITEWGISTDNGRCLGENYGFNPCMTYQEAAETLRKNVAEIRSYLGSRMGLFLLYQVRDQAEPGKSSEREAYFGLLQHELKPKGAYTTAAQEMLAD